MRRWRGLNLGSLHVNVSVIQFRSIQSILTVFSKRIMGPTPVQAALINLYKSGFQKQGPKQTSIATFRVPAVYLRLALWAFLACWAQRKMSKLRGFNQAQ
jgi:hypothetical protein